MSRTKIYTAYENVNAGDACERVELVREGFCFGAFVFNVLWLLYHRLWFASACYMGLLIALGMWAEALGLNPVTGGAVQLLLQLLLGFHAHDLQRLKLTRRGYHFAAVIVAENDLSAEQRYYAHAT